ncbi:AfsR/SARP family transcriptional regulator [Thermomonospora umbrina]|uniref:AfsR/SARP family transcriptional regulator n=1 Tax=Thermomonospora umbrina TaxID=111806 RepID=UPI000E21EF14|nr:AfsR/SARP family transcriptional regulator [Thermomonospora umbrina]
MELRILGPVQAVSGGRAVELGGRRARLVLAALSLDPGRVVSVDRLMAAVWGDRPPASARTQIAGSVSRLRRALRDPGAVETAHPGYRLPVDAVRLDSREAERLVTRAREAAASARPDEAAGMFRAALALWRGPVLAGLDSPALAPAALRWEELRLAAVEEAAELDVALDRSREVVAELMPLVAEHPFRERLRALLMTALHREGRQAEALALYRDGRRILDEDLGLEPGRELRRLHDAILRDDLPGPRGHGRVRGEGACREGRSRRRSPRRRCP